MPFTALRIDLKAQNMFREILARTQASNTNDHAKGIPGIRLLILKKQKWALWYARTTP